MEKASQKRSLMKRFNMGDDCPVFAGMFDFIQLSSGGSVNSAIKLNKKTHNTCINWAGGMHHAKKSNASGFCYVNDIVLAILELLKYHRRVIYIDIDFHHGDGVEEAFYTTDRVMTVSFHRYGDNFFPGTGHLREIGVNEGKYYCVNVPLNAGITDKTYESIFVPIVTKVMEMYQPEAIVLQCGADSLAKDRVGDFNLTLKGHGKCVAFMKEYNLPLLLLGGGGYKLSNTARCWTYDTSVALDVEIPNEIPLHCYFEYFGPSYSLHLNPNKIPNLNSIKYLNNIKTTIFEKLRRLPFAPGMQILSSPEDALTSQESDDDTSIDERLPQSLKDNMIMAENEFYDAEDDHFVKYPK